MQAHGSEFRARIIFNMLQLYYKIWVSTFIKIKETHNCNDQPALLLSMMIVIAANFCNYLLLCLLSITILKINPFIPHLLASGNRFLIITVAILMFLVPNYFLLVFDNKHERLLERYEDKVNKNIGVYYFCGSALLVILLILSTLAFPELYGLSANPEK